jgi:signal transduction histidine kinase
MVDQANALQGNVLGLMAGNIAISVFVAWLLRDAAHPALVWGWFALQVSNGLFNGWAGWRVGRRPASPRSAPRRLRAAAIASTISGLLWGAGVLLLWPPGQLELQLLIIFMVVGLTASALHSLHAWLPAFLGFYVPCAGSIALATLWHGGWLNYVIAANTVIHSFATWRFATALNRTLTDSMRRRHEVAELAADLQVQKERAEEASLAKSRFLAAASHDLRQPVHALTLFVGALAQQPLGPEARRLLGHVGGAADTMGAMFNALLDMSRLDAGMVRPEVRAFDLLPMLERIAADEGGMAQAKGLALRLNASPLAVLSDPVHVERILRNLAANAVRYTDQGGVLITARRRGAAVVVRVVDTGIGIPAERQAEVFEEFVQLHNPERDRNKGLGLGLAIVRRLAGLLGAPLRLRSRPGRGSVFSLTLPPARAVVVAQAAPAAAPPAVAIGTGDLVLVVDDDAEIRAGMHSLLAGWGCEVVGAAGSADLMPQLLSLTRVPRLIISDYRLQGDETGIAVIERVQSEYNEDIPAILITGDTAPARLREAQASGYTLLHKPVGPQALRGAMQALLAAQAEGA